MMLDRLGLINKSQRGITVIELIIAVALSVIIAGATTATIFQVIEGSTRTSNHLAAVSQVQSAGYWVSRDAHVAQSVSVTLPDGFPITLAWTDWENGDEYQVVYSENTTGGLTNLQRSYYVNGSTVDTIFVARFIYPDETNCKLLAGSFSLPDVGDEYTITDGAGGDSGVIIIATGNVSVTPDGTATYNAATGAWATPGAGDTIKVIATAAGTSGDWTNTAKTATAAITADGDGNATITNSEMLVFTITTRVGAGSQAESETRVYRVLSRPSS